MCMEMPNEYKSPKRTLASVLLFQIPRAFPAIPLSPYLAASAAKHSGQIPKGPKQLLRACTMRLDPAAPSTWLMALALLVCGT